MKKAKQQGARPNKSHKIIAELKYSAKTAVSVPNPNSALLKSTAKHIEWMELLLTGITGRERGTIAKLTRRNKQLEKMVFCRDEKNKEMVFDRKEVKSIHAQEVKDMLEEFERRYGDLEEMKLEILPAIRDQIEREFIDQLRSSEETSDGDTARAMLRQQLNYMKESAKWQSLPPSSTGSTDNRYY